MPNPQASRGRIERFRFASARTVKKHAPWAVRVVRVGGIFVAYERHEDANEEHGKVCEPVKNPVPAWNPIGSLYDPFTIQRAARRRGENA